MTAPKSLVLFVGLFVAALAFSKVSQAQPIAGSWALRPAEAAGKVELSFVYGHSTQSSDHWRLADLTGLDLVPAGRHDVHFTIARDAGRIEGEGSAASGTAAGSFQFTPAPDYADHLRKLGLGEVRPEAQLSLALHDVSLAFGRDMLALGFADLTADKLLAMRIHEVTPDYVAAIEKLGYARPGPDQLITLRIHGVTPDYIASIKAKGVRDISLDQLVAMKIQGID